MSVATGGAVKSRYVVFDLYGAVDRAVWGPVDRVVGSAVESNLCRSVYWLLGPDIEASVELPVRSAVSAVLDRE